MNFPSILIASSNNEINFPHKALLTGTQMSATCRAFANGYSANVKFLKTRMSKIVQLGGFLFGPPNIFDSTIQLIKEKTS